VLTFGASSGGLRIMFRLEHEITSLVLFHDGMMARSVLRQQSGVDDTSWRAVHPGVDVVAPGWGQPA